MENNYVIYMHYNKVNGKVYIGQTNNAKARWRPSGYKHCVKFYNAINKYGWENFEHFILESDLTLEQANQREEFYIEKYNSIEQGYNIYKGGNNREMSKETLEKLSKKSLECWGDEEYQKKQHESRLASWNGDAGLIRKESISKRMKELWENPEYRAKKIEQHTGGNNPNARKVICITTGEIFDSMADAARKYHTNSSNMRLCCLGKRNYAGKRPDTNESLRWKYYNYE